MSHLSDVDREFVACPLDHYKAPKQLQDVVDALLIDAGRKVTGFYSVNHTIPYLVADHNTHSISDAFHFASYRTKGSMTRAFIVRYQNRFFVFIGSLESILIRFVKHIAKQP